MENTKELYFIQGWIPTDEDKIITNLYKQVKIGGTYAIYIFIGINVSHGFGTAVEKPGHNTKEESILSLLKVSGFNNGEGSISILEYLTFDEAIDKLGECECLLLAEKNKQKYSIEK